MRKLAALLVLCLCVHRHGLVWPQSHAKSLPIKLRLFTDAALNQHLENNLRISNKNELQNLVTAYIKQVEANISGLSASTCMSIRLELADEVRTYKPEEPPNGDIDQLLDQFCTYQALTRANESALTNWSLSLLLTSLDLFSGEDTRDSGASLEGSYSTMGVSVIDGINWSNLGCLIVELGVNYNEPLDSLGSTRDYGWLNPSRGFASTWVAAHEIGHSLGLHHDGPPFNPDCRHGGVMSSESNISSINSTWSRCSLDRFEQLIRTIPYNSNYTRASSIELKELPGQVFDLQNQCRTFSTYLDLSHENIHASMCDKTIWCQLQSTGSTGLKLIPIGPALEGTYCDGLKSKICFKRRCIGLLEFLASENDSPDSNFQLDSSG